MLACSWELQVVLPVRLHQWKISQMSNAVLWRAGGFRDMMQTGTVPKEAQSSEVQRRS
jgi:hypothetical protein